MNQKRGRRMLAGLCAILAMLLTVSGFAEAGQSPNRTVTVTYVDGNGVPIPDIAVSKTLFEPEKQNCGSWMEGDSGIQSLHNGFADSQGQYVYHTPYDGVLWTMVEDTLIEVPVTEEREQQVTVTYRPADFSVTFRVKDRQGKPVNDTGITVEINAPLLPGPRIKVNSHNGRTDRDGEYVWKNAKCGVHTLFARSDGWHIEQELAIGPNVDQDLVVDVTVVEKDDWFPMEDRYRRLVDRSGNPLINERVRSYVESIPGGRPVCISDRLTDENGELRFWVGQRVQDVVIRGKPVRITFLPGSKRDIVI